MEGFDGFAFDAMAADERELAWQALWARVSGGGSEESVNLLFWADDATRLPSPTASL